MALLYAPAAGAYIPRSYNRVRCDNYALLQDAINPRDKTTSKLDIAMASQRMRKILARSLSGKKVKHYLEGEPWPCLCLSFTLER